MSVIVKKNPLDSRIFAKFYFPLWKRFHRPHTFPSEREPNSFPPSYCTKSRMHLFRNAPILSAQRREPSNYITTETWMAVRSRRGVQDLRV